MAHIRHNHERGGNIVGLHFDGNNIVRRYVDGTDLSSGVSAQETVPEPASLVLLFLAVGFVAKRRRGIKFPISD